MANIALKYPLLSHKLWVLLCFVFIEVTYLGKILLTKLADRSSFNMLFHMVSKLILSCHFFVAKITGEPWALFNDLLDNVFSVLNFVFVKIGLLCIFLRAL